MTDKFWFVWRVGGDGPTHRHVCEQSAKWEAERLARINPGVEFVVLEATHSVTKNDVLWRELETNEPPF